MIYLGIGSNLGDRRKNIEIAKFEIAQKGVNIINCSNFYESLSWPNINYPKFLNIVLRVDTNLTPLKLIKICKDIEKSLGRKESIRNAPRVCDIDILDYKKKRINNKIETYVTNLKKDICNHISGITFQDSSEQAELLQ